MANIFEGIDEKFNEGVQRAVNLVEIAWQKELAAVSLSRLVVIDPEHAANYTGALQAIGK